MPSTAEIIDETRTLIQYVVPYNCTPLGIHQVSTRPSVGRYHTWNDVSRRPKPEPKDLNKSVTDLPIQLRAKYSGPIGYDSIFLPCPHGGVHGDQEQRTWYWSPVIYSPVSPFRSDLWSFRAREKVDAKKTNLGSTLAEYKESVRMFGGFTEGLHNAYKVLRGKRRRRKVSVCSIPAAILQYNFGIAPLASDLYDSIEVLRLRLGLPIFQRISTTGSETLNGIHEQGDFRIRYRGTKSQRATFFLELEPSFTGGAINFGNPLEWAWELIPFSFMVDWAIPIGDWLGSLDSLKGTKQLYGTVTTKISERHYSWVDRDSFTQFTNGQGRFKSHQRDVITSIPLPPFPKWEPSSSYKRLLNSLSILGVMNKRCKHK